MMGRQEGEGMWSAGRGTVGGQRGDRFVRREAEVAIDYLSRRSDVFVKGPLTGMGTGREFQR